MRSRRYPPTGPGDQNLRAVQDPETKTSCMRANMPACHYRGTHAEHKRLSGFLRCEITWVEYEEAPDARLDPLSHSGNAEVVERQGSSALASRPINITVKHV